MILNSAELPNSLSSNSELPLWSEVRRIYRRICVLRATGKNDEASELERNDFFPAITAARQAPEAAQMEMRILAEENERVASASVLAELLAPLLATKLQATGAGPLAAAAAVRKPESPLAAPPRRARVASPENSETAAAGVPGIADMIDGMLSQERDSYAPSRRGA